MNSPSLQANPPLPPPRRRPELLAPAGDAECLRAAIENGADAVYFGLETGFNARARAKNFSLEELSAALDLLHRRGVKGYVTLNTLAFPSELPELENIIRLVAEAGVDAVLVQDLGVVRLIRAICPDLSIHASTQMTLTSAECVAFVQSLGVERVVLARELSVREIAKIHRQSTMPVEVFVHGALCVAYSGQCLTSESLGGRSANRGQCAQACRLPYDLMCDGREVDLGDVKYLLSPQDLAAYELVPDLIDAGVCSFKIEGRLKTPEYVANITRHYREAIDSAMAGRPVQFTPRQVEEMELSFSRGFSPGWLEGCEHKRLVPGQSSSKRGVFLGEVQAVRRGRIAVRLAAPIKRGDGVSFDCGRPEDDEQGGRVYEVFKGGHSLEEAVSTGTVELAFAHGLLNFAEIWPGQQVWKTDDPELTSRLRKTFTGPPQRRVPLDLVISAGVGRPLVVSAQAESGATCLVTTPGSLEEARKHPLTAELLREQFGRLGGTLYELRSLDAHIDGQPMVPLSVLGKLRHELVRALDASRVGLAPRHIAAGSALAELRTSFNRDPEGPPRKNPASQTTTSADPTESARKRESLTVADGSRLNEQIEIQPTLRVLCRSLHQLRGVFECGVTSLYADFQDIRQYREAVRLAHTAGAEIFIATPRIQKPDEPGLFRALMKHKADGILVRNLGGLLFYAKQNVPFVADFSLNVTNELSAQLLMEHGALRLTPSYDLNREQLLDLVSAVPPAWLEVVVHQHMPMFHMEHCVFCAVLSPGTNKTNCGRPCDVHEVKLRDRLGMEHPLVADVGCRNTLFNAVPQSAAEAVPQLLARGVRHFRIELLTDQPADLRSTIRLYRDLLAGRVSGQEVWRELKAANRVGVTRGTLEERRNPLAIL